MNELEQRAKLHGSKKNGLSPFCSLSEESDSDYYNYITKLKTVDDDAIDPPEEDMSSFVKRVTSDGLIQYVADRIESLQGKNYLIGFKSDMSEVKFLLGTPGQRSSYYNVKHLLESPYWHIPLSLKEELTDMYLSKDMNEAGYRSGDRYYGGLPAEPEYEGPGKSARYWKELTQYFKDTVREYPEYYVIGTSPVAVTLKTPDGKETIDLTKFDALADADEAVEMASHYFDASLFEAKKKKKPFDSINTDAGNVEHNIAMFNKAANPAEAPCTNPVSGPMGEALESERWILVKSNKWYDPEGLGIEPEGTVLCSGTEDECRDKFSDIVVKARKDDRLYREQGAHNHHAPFMRVDKLDKYSLVISYPHAQSKDVYQLINKSAISNEDVDDDILRNHGYRQDNLKPTFEVGDRVAHRWADEYNVGTIKDSREHEGIQYQVEWDYSDGDYVEWLYGDEITHWVDVNENLTEAAPKKETIELEYKDLEFTQYGNQRDADDWDEWDRCMDWTYEVDKDDLYTFIFESCIDESDFPEAFEDDFDPNNAEHWARFESWLDDNFDTIYSKYEEKILENWEEDAQEEAAGEYDPDDYVDWDSMPGGHDDDRYWESLNEEYKREPRMIDYFEQMNSEEDEA